MFKLLIVDDSEFDRRVAGAILEERPEFRIEYAENGAVALERIRANRPNVVVTDLQMPVMDGLELVTNVRVQFPDVPVVLVTAHGSEELAVEALEQGATTYVPKSQLQEKLLSTIEEILARSNADRTYEKLVACMNYAEFDYALENEVALLDPLVDLAQQIVSGKGLCDSTERFRIGVALREALLNALYRGNLEISREQMQEARENLLLGRGMGLVDERRAQSPFRERRIHVNLRINSAEARFVIRDDGPGFDAKTVSATPPTESLDSTSGRGLLLMRSFMDEVQFNDQGNTVTLIKRKKAN